MSRYLAQISRIIISCEVSRYICAALEARLHADDHARHYSRSLCAVFRQFVRGSDPTRQRPGCQKGSYRCLMPPNSSKAEVASRSVNRRSLDHLKHNTKAFRRSPPSHRLTHGQGTRSIRNGFKYHGAFCKDRLGRGSAHVMGMHSRRVTTNLSPSIRHGMSTRGEGTRLSNLEHRLSYMMRQSLLVLRARRVTVIFSGQSQQAL